MASDTQLHQACCAGAQQLRSARRLRHVACVIFEGCTLIRYLLVGVCTNTDTSFHISVLCVANSLQKDVRCFPVWRISLGATRTCSMCSAHATCGEAQMFRSSCPYTFTCGKTHNRVDTLMHEKYTQRHF